MTLTATDHGAVADGTTLNSTALQKQLDACAANGGGTLRFPAGRYLTGSLVIGSFTTIELEPGAVLVGSSDLADYKPIGMESENRDTALLFAHRARDVTIRGGGTIDGNGDAFFDLTRGTVPRDYDPARTRQGAAYAERPDGAETGPVHYRAVDDRQAGDDGIAITPCADGYHLEPSEHVNVTNCTISSRNVGAGRARAGGPGRWDRCAVRAAARRSQGRNRMTTTPRERSRG